MLTLIQITIYSHGFYGQGIPKNGAMYLQEDSAHCLYTLENSYYGSKQVELVDL
jgi:hypothetical protein